MIEPGLLVAAQATVDRAVRAVGAMGIEEAVQDADDQESHLRGGQRGRPDFFPAWFPASGTRWRSATALDDDANRARCALDSRPSPPPPWLVSDCPQCDARP